MQNFFKFLKYIAEGTVLKMSQNCNSNSVGHLWLSYSEFAQSCPTLCDPTDSSQAPPSMGFSRQEYWSGVPFPSPGDLPDQGSNLGLLHCRQTLYPNDSAKAAGLHLRFLVKMRCEMGADHAFINLYNDYLACTMCQRLW